MNKLSTIDCPHFNVCSGCTLNNPYSPSIFDDVKQFYMTHSVDIGALETGAVTGWRVKAKLAVRNEIGLFRAHSHDVVPMPQCKTHHPSINQAVVLLKEALKIYPISTYNEQTRRGDLRYIQCLVDLTTNKVQLTLVSQSTSPTLTRLAEHLYNTGHFHSIYLNIQPISTNQILSSHWIHLHGPAFLAQKLASHTFYFHPGAFTQAHWTLFEKLALQVVSWVPESSHLLEIYAGVGIMGILAASKCASVTLVENNPFAHQSFLATNAPVLYRLGDAKDAIPLLPKATTILVDPPRKGLDPALLSALHHHAGTLIYVSCDFNSFERDATSLIASGWTLKKGKAYLLFPGTNHVETTALFEK